MRREKARRTVPCVRVEGFLLGVDAKVLKVSLVDCDLVRLHRVRVSWLSVRDPQVLLVLLDTRSLWLRDYQAH